jgi:hypothetical protein
MLWLKACWPTEKFQRSRHSGMRWRATYIAATRGRGCFLNACTDQASHSPTLDRSVTNLLISGVLLCKTHTSRHHGLQVGSGHDGWQCRTHQV